MTQEADDYLDCQWNNLAELGKIFKLGSFDTDFKFKLLKIF